MKSLSLSFWKSFLEEFAIIPRNISLYSMFTSKHPYNFHLELSKLVKNARSDIFRQKGLERIWIGWNRKKTTMLNGKYSNASMLLNTCRDLEKYHARGLDVDFSKMGT